MLLKDKGILLSVDGVTIEAMLAKSKARIQPCGTKLQTQTPPRQLIWPQQQLDIQIAIPKNPSNQQLKKQRLVSNGISRKRKKVRQKHSP